MSGSEDSSTIWTRRSFLNAVGRAGGAAAAYEAMTALGLLHVPDLFAATQFPRNGKGKSVVILGAGIAGLTAAYELTKAGYAVTVLEAKRRTGGRSLTVRRGDVIEEVNERGERTTQTCNFDEGLYMNAGPGRLPHHHTAVLHYCRELRVPLEVYVMSTRANLYQKEGFFGGAPVQNRRLNFDLQGYVAELLSKAINRNALDDALTPGDREALLEVLKGLDRLDKEGRYHGTWSSGAESDPDVATAGKPMAALPMSELLGSRFWRNFVFQADMYEWQGTLFQPAGGMDKIAKAFAAALPRRTVRLEREVTSVQNVEGGVRVTHRNAQTKRDEERTAADWCISTINMPILAKIDNNFDADFRSSIAACSFEPTCKVGWQANRRFWEEDNQIYGGISYVDHNITQLWYPSTEYFTSRGVLCGAYNYEKEAEAMRAMAPAERLSLAAEGARRLHPDFDRWVPRELGMSIAWKNVPYQCGGWPGWTPQQVADYERLLKPHGRVLIAGDQVSYVPGWQEGAIRSALHVVKAIVTPEASIDLRVAEAPRSPRASRWA